MARSKIDHLRELLDKATPGPWETAHSMDAIPDDGVLQTIEHGTSSVVYRRSLWSDSDGHGRFDSQVIPMIAEDAALIASLRNHAGALLGVAEATRCQEAYSHARESNDWMPVLVDAGWDGFESPTTFLHRQRRHALAALDEVTT